MIHWQPGTTLEQVEKQVILAALRFFGGNKTKTAQAIGIAIRTLDYKLESYEGKNGLQSKAEGIKSEKQDEIQSNRGSDLESSVEVPKKSAMPMSKRKKVQEVLSK